MTFHNTDSLIEAVKDGKAKFVDVISYIEKNYQYTPTAFNNGNQQNSENENQGSAKVFGLAKLIKLDKTETLNLFAEHYQSVLANPNGQDHSNIRNFIQFGWNGLIMDNMPLSVLSSSHTR